MQQGGPNTSGAFQQNGAVGHTTSHATAQHCASLAVLGHAACAARAPSLSGLKPDMSSLVLPTTRRVDPQLQGPHRAANTNACGQHGSLLLACGSQSGERKGLSCGCEARRPRPTATWCACRVASSQKSVTIIGTCTIALDFSRLCPLRTAVLRSRQACASFYVCDGQAPGATTSTGYRQLTRIQRDRATAMER